jgi:N-acetylmuramoyl-L-alanine amidase
MRRIEMAVNRVLVLTLLGSGLVWLFSCIVTELPLEPPAPRPVLAPVPPPPRFAPPPPSELSFSKGRSLTPAPRAAFTVLPLLEKVAGGAIHASGRIQYADRGIMRPTAIVLHATSGKNLSQAITALESRGAAVHVIVDESGHAYQAMDGLEEQGRAARGLDEAALHVSIAGKTDREMLDNKPQLKKVTDLLRALVYRYDIPVNNHDVASRQGIFSHGQAIKRFGGMIPNDPLHPGEAYMKVVLEGLGGTFFEEKDWKDRHEEGWVFVLEGGSSGRNGPARQLKGRGLTPTPRAALSEVEQNPDGTILEEKRLRYPDRGAIAVSAVVLHFTATETFESTRRALEDRRLCASLIVDTDGKAYQTLDALEERPAAAAETNAFAIQIEIVGRNEAALLANEPQKQKVILLVSRLCEKYQIPRNNQDIESHRGIFSHGQQKKRWGHSAWLHPGTDFDPGESYMKEILEGVGGTYHSEATWKGRREDRWAILYDDWNP